MKTLLALLAVSATLLSCSDDNYNADDDFYGLRSGKVLVYKKYTVDENGVETYTNKIDTVTIDGQQDINGLSYYKFHHKVYYNNALESESNDYRRVDGDGYLVDENNVVIHPGFEKNYVFTENLGSGVQPLGTAVYQLGDISEFALQNSTFAVYRYIGTINPISGSIPAGVGMERDYAASLGVVKFRTRYLASLAYLEDRLVSYQNN